MFKKSLYIIFVYSSLISIVDADPLKQVATEAGRALDKAVARRITLNLTQEAPKETQLDNSIWGSFIYTRIDDNDLSELESDETDIDFGIDMFQHIIGADKTVGDFLFGLSGGYIHVDFFAEFSDDDPGEDTTHTLDAGFFSPYFAYSINDNVFISGLVNYTHSSSHVIEYADIVNTELAANGVFKVFNTNNWILKGKLAHRYTYIDAALEDEDASFDFFVNSVVGDVEILYQIGPFSPYFGVQYEYGFPEKGSGDDVLFVRGGVGYEINKSISLNLNYQSELLVDLISIHQAGLNVRFSF